MKSKILDLLWNCPQPIIKSLIAGVAIFVSVKLFQNHWKPDVDSQCDNCECNNSVDKKKKLKILFGSEKGVSESLSLKCSTILCNDVDITSRYNVQLISIKDYEPDEIISDANSGSTIIIFMPTYMHGEPSENSKWFCKWICDASTDFRVSRNTLSKLSFAIVGIGDSGYGSDYCLLARNLNTWLEKLTAKRFHSTYLIDVNSSTSVDNQFYAWITSMCPQLIKCDCSDHLSQNEECNEIEDSDISDLDSNHGDSVVDLEDIVKPKNTKKSNGFEAKPIRDMITPQLRKELTKQNYKLVGSHSGVKLCRWTKSMLRGRG